MAISLTRADIEAKLTKAFSPEQAASLVDIFDTIRQIELERAADTQDLKRGLTELTEEVKKLTVAQQHTDERLTESIQRTDQRFAELAEAQRHTDERLAGLDERLTESIQRTDQRFAELAEAQRRTDETLKESSQRVAELAEAQRRTDETLKESSQRLDRALETLANAVTDLRQTVGSLANTFGFDLEEFVAALLPPYLERHGGIRTLSLERRFFEVGDGQTEEIDLVGSGQRDGKSIMVLVECHTTIGGGEMRRLARKLDRVAATLTGGEVIKIVVAMNLHPAGAEAAQEVGIWAIPYSRINRDRMEI